MSSIKNFIKSKNKTWVRYIKEGCLSRQPSFYKDIVILHNKQASVMH